jgi:hypothetical protein
MSDIDAKIAYLKGLADGLKIEGDLRLVLDAAVDVLSEVKSAVEGISMDVGELQDDVDDIADALDELVEDLFEEDDEDEDYDEAEGYIELACPKCDRHILFDIESFNADDDHRCSCGAELFTDDEADEEEQIKG